MERGKNFEAMPGGESKTPEQERRIRQEGDFFAVAKDQHEAEKDQPHAENKIMTPEQWFGKYYKGQPDEELPKEIFKDIDPEELIRLRKEHKDQEPKTNPEIEQLDIFDQKM